MTDEQADKSAADHAKRILLELGTPAGAFRQEHRDLENRFVDAISPQMELLMGAEPKGEGVTHFAIRQLLARATSDMFATVHLLTHGYLSQAYNTLRTAYETLDLVELLSTIPGEAELWEETGQGHRDFSPGAVRKRLGKNSFDEVYGHFSEAAHPRFKSAGLNSFGKKRDGDDHLYVVVNIGPTLLDESPEQWFLAMFLTMTIGLLSARVGRLVDAGGITRPIWQAAAQETQTALQDMTKLVADQLSAFGLDANDIVAEYDNIGRPPEEVVMPDPSDTPG